jgi:guanylate kinase
MTTDIAPGLRTDLALAASSLADPTLPSQLHRRGLMLALSAPSGGGKTTIARALLERDANLTLSISATTRGRRPNEVHGRDYHFVDIAEFETMIADDALLEHAQVFGNRYGTPRVPVEAALSAGRDVLFDIDWQGVTQVGAKAAADLVTVFILPPSYAELERRLVGRGQDSAEIVAGRMAKAADEMRQYSLYDYIIVNEVLDASVAQVAAILAAERHRRQRLRQLPAFVTALTQA